MKYFFFFLLVFLSLQSNQTLFTLNLYQKLIQDNSEKNIMFSPYSLRIALAILYEGVFIQQQFNEIGCANQSARQIEETCFLSANREKRLSTMKDSISKINEQNENYELKTVNALWPQNSNDFTMNEDYLSTIEQYYFGGIRELDYIKQAEQSRKTINEWVSNETNERIQNLIPSGIIDTDTRLVITNCIYFKGIWQRQFDKKNTITSTFYITEKNTTQISMMQLKEEEFKYYENDVMQMVELDYEGDHLSMIIVLPDTNNKEEFNQQLTSSNLQTWISKLSLETVDLSLPKFKFEWTESLNDVLQNLGIQEIFIEGQADLSKISDLPLYVSKVIQKTFVEVNEQGTEAAAATAVVVNLEMVSQSIVFNANHPFMFLIYHKSSEEILFFGKVLNPTKEENNFEMNFYKLNDEKPDQKENGQSRISNSEIVIIVISILIILSIV